MLNCNQAVDLTGKEAVRYMQKNACRTQPVRTSDT